MFLKRKYYAPKKCRNSFDMLVFSFIYKSKKLVRNNFSYDFLVFADMKSQQTLMIH